ncbi:MAG: ABC transporter ATP-binding protein [bacterium]|nr:ABC transporter ATP-binding protein [bacterium]
MEESSSSDTLTEEPPAEEAEEAAAESVEPEESAPDEAPAEEEPVEEEPAEEAAAPAPAGETLVQAEGLAKHYGPIRAVDGISFNVRRGEVLGFLGPNGAGKTTAMRLITGFLEPDAGRVEVAGHDLACESLQARQKIGYLPENAPAYGEMTVTGFLEFIAEARAIDDIPGAIARVVARTGLTKVQHQTIETLSKGFKRRVGLAQALIHDPEVLILDEPTDGLDPNQKALVQELLSDLAAEKCIIVSTHILDEVERICNRAMIISQGRILVDSTPQDLIALAPNHNVIRLTLHEDDPTLAARIEAEPWCARVETYSASTIDVHPEGGENHLMKLLDLVKELPIQDVRLQEGRLEDLFRKITEGVSA